MESAQIDASIRKSNQVFVEKALKFARSVNPQPSIQEAKELYETHLLNTILAPVLQSERDELDASQLDLSGDIDQSSLVAIRTQN
jgi:hypothetical protein